MLQELQSAAAVSPAPEVRAPAAVDAPAPGICWWGRAGLLLVLIAYAALLLSRFAPAIVEPDANGYWAQGSLMATAGHTWFVPQSSAQYIGMHWLVTDSGKYISRYPPGLPLLIGIIYLVLGYKAAVFVNPALALLTLTGLYALARRFVSPGWALFAVGSLAASSVFTTHALENFSHMAVAAVLVWGLYFLVRWSEQGKLRQALIAGLLLGCIPTIRYPDAVMGAGVAVFLLWHWRRFPRMWLHYAAAIAGAMVPILPLLIRNQLVLGGFWRTGYALTNEQTGFSLDYFLQHFHEYLRTMSGEGLGMMFILGLGAMTWMVCTRARRAFGMMLLLIAVPLMLVYMAYYWGGRGNMTMRFLVPTLACYVLAGTWALAEALKQAPPAARVAAALVMLALQVTVSVPQVLRGEAAGHYQKQVLARVTDALDVVATREDLILAQRGLTDHLDFVRHWRGVADLSIVQENRAGGRGPIGMGRPGPAGPRGQGPVDGPPGGPFDDDPDSPSPMQAEKRRAQQLRYTGTAEQRRQQFARDVRAWAGDGKVYFVGPERELRQGAAGMIGGGNFRIVQRIELPEAPEMSDLRARRGPRGMGAGAGGLPRPGGMPPGPGGAGPGGPGPMGLGPLAGETELVIAELGLAGP